LNYSDNEYLFLRTNKARAILTDKIYLY